MLLTQCTERNVGGVIMAMSEKRPLKKSLALRRTSLTWHSLERPGDKRLIRSLRGKVTATASKSRSREKYNLNVNTTWPSPRALKSPSNQRGQWNQALNENNQMLVFHES